MTPSSIALTAATPRTVPVGCPACLDRLDCPGGCRCAGGRGTAATGGACAGGGQRPRASAWWGLSPGRRPTLVCPCSMASSWRWTRSMPWAATSAARWSWSSRTTGPTRPGPQGVAGTAGREGRCHHWLLQLRRGAQGHRPVPGRQSPLIVPCATATAITAKYPRPTATFSACKGATRSRRRSSWTTSSNAAGTRSPFCRQDRLRRGRL